MPSTAAGGAAGSYSLTPEELQRWETKGYLGPYTAWSRDEMEQLMRRIRAVYAHPSAAFGFYTTRDRHLDSHALCMAGTHPAIVERCAALYGPDLLLWRSQFFHKPPGGDEILYHQDLGFPGWKHRIPALEPCTNVAAWLACTTASKANGCVKLLPGTHLQPMEERPTDGSGPFGRDTELVGLERFEPVYMELEPGQFFLFNESVVHGSDANRSDTDRTGVVFRFTPTSTRIYSGRQFDDSGMPVKAWHAILVHGRDDEGHNRLGPAPSGENLPGRVGRLIGRVRRRYYRLVHGMHYS